MTVLLFDGDDAGYLKWMAENPDGYVLNTKRQDRARVCSIHRSGCAHIRVLRNQKGLGGFTERNGIKLCSRSYRDLIDHLGAARRSPLLRVVPCKRCDPGKVELVLDRSPDEVGAEHAQGPHTVAIHVNMHELDPLARAKCIHLHGKRCSVCNVDLEQVYGALGKDAMRVHHIHTVDTLNKGYEVDPLKDLVPICPNCHLILHRGRDHALKVEDLRRIMARARVQWVRMKMAQGQY